MRRSLLTLVLGITALSGATTANAQSVTQIRSRAPQNVQAQVSQRNAALNVNALKAAAPAVRHAGVNPSDYGQEVTILSEDFSLMTDGAYGDPAFQDTITHVNEDGNVWLTMNDGWTHQTGWGGHSIYPAGGSVVVYGDYGNLNTPMVNVSGNDAVSFIRFKARTDSHNTQGMQVEAAETFNMSPTWRILESYQITDLTQEWKTYTFMFHNGGETTIYNMVPMNFDRAHASDSVAVYFDDVEVLQAIPNVHMPQPVGHRNYQGTSFDVNWTKVADADHYLLNVIHQTITQRGMSYSVNRDTLLADQVVADTIYNVQGTKSGDDYFFTVRAVKGNNVSYESPELQVCDLVSPVPTTEGLTDGSNTYEVRWDAVPSAERYNYWAYAERSADADGTFTVTNEDFTGVKCPSTSFTDYFTEQDWQNITSDTPGTDNYMILGQYVCDPFNQPGWVVKNGMPMSDGCVKVDGYQYVNNHSDAGLVSPELDLSKNNGLVNVSVDLKGQTDYTWFEDSLYTYPTPHVAFAIFNWDEQKGDYTQTELIVKEDLEETWKNYNIQFTTGSERSVIGIYAIYSPTNMFIDNLKITQDYKSDENFEDPIFYSQYVEGTNLTVTIPDRASNNFISHRMTAVKTNQVTQALVESQLNDRAEVGLSKFTTGIQSVNLSNADVQFDGNNIVVKGNASVYTLDGRLVKKVNAVNGSANLDLPSGAYIVKTGNKSIKVVF